MKFDAKTSIYKAVENIAFTYPERIAFYYMKKKFRYKKLLTNINSFSQKLLELGVKKNDVITTVLPNIPEAVYLLYSINQLGAIANLIHPLMKLDQLEGILEETKSKYVFVLNTTYDEFMPLIEKGITVIPCSPTDELMKPKQVIYSKMHSGELKNANKATLNCRDFFNQTPYRKHDKEYMKDSFYLHSGGTTGKSKTIALSNFSLNSLNANDPWIVGKEDLKGSYMLSVLPMFHGFGLAMGIHAELSHGGTNMLMPKFNTQETIKYIKQHHMTIMIGVPTLYEALLRHKSFKGSKLKGIDVAFIGGDFVAQSLIDRFNERMDFYHSRCRMFEGYGLTETVTVCSVNTHTNHKEGTVGQMLPNCKVKVMDLEGKKVLGPDDLGELYIAGDTLMNGYRFTNEKQPFYPVNGVTWVRTGDLGSVDEDGYIHFKQRIKRLIKVNGINVFPSEIENVVKKVEDVFDCCAIGVKDPKHGEMVKLFIVLDKSSKKTNIDDEINDLIVKQCGIYARPKAIVYVDKFNKTLVGKVDYKKFE
jgi:long-chain acyl-CoA synthetase